MCGILGIINENNRPVNQSLVDGLTVLQHRGQDSAGIATIHDTRFHMYKNKGLVSEVFNQENIIQLIGNMGIGHVRYSTSGSTSLFESQPLYTNTPFGLALVHNGNLTNVDELKEYMILKKRNINTNSDSELLLNIFAEELYNKNVSNINQFDIFETVKKVMEKCKGGYSVIVVINRLGMVAFRDPCGIRPLCFGKNKNGYVFASESVAIDVLDNEFSLTRDVHPGECIFINHCNEIHAHNVCEKSSLNPCIFEYIYFARPDSIIDGISVYNARLEMGNKLAEKIINKHPNLVHDIDVIIPVPETSRISALQISQKLNIPYREGFVKNRYVPRTFILPGQEIRKKSVKLKLNTIQSIFQGKNILIVDDSIVRGTTCMQLIQLAKKAGAKKIFFSSAAPMVKYPNVYGIDIPFKNELIANSKNETEIAFEIGADEVIYNDLIDVIDACNLNLKYPLKFETSCFDGFYITGNIDDEYLKKLEKNRGSPYISNPGGGDTTSK
jgi:amidophosphoribosyltransferase